MANIIYGVGRHQREVEYVFHELEIAYYIDDDITEEEHRIFPIDKILTEDIQKLRIIICDDKDEQKAARLKSYGLIHGVNYFFAEELYASLNETYYYDINEVPTDIVVWGTGKVSDILRKKYSNLHILYYIDSDMKKAGTYVDKIEVRHPSMIHNWKENYIVIAVNGSNAIVKTLINNGLQEKENFIRFDQVNGAPSEMMRKVCEALQQDEAICMQMFRFAFVGVGGEVHLCCPHMIYNVPAGNLIQNTWDECWNSNIARIMRLSIINKTFCFCDRTQCAHFLHDNAEFKINADDIRDYKIGPLQVPKELVLAFEASCNLKCTSCRKDFKFQPTEEEKEILDVYTEKLMEVAQRVETLTVSGNGDPIFSKYYRQLWMNEIEGKRKDINLITNGLLFNENNWMKMESLYENIYLDVSMDAATKETYEKIRIGGNFDVLLENMELAGKLRSENRIKHLTIRFVVQRNNYKEMKRFITFGKKINADIVLFCKIANWNLYNSDEFEKISMYDNNDNMLPELKEVLNDPIFKDSVVKLTNIRGN